MKRKWLTIGAVIGLGVVGGIAATAMSIANKIDYDVLSYSVQLLSSEGVTFRIMYGITNPSRADLDIWSQKYDVFIAGHHVSKVASFDRYKLAGGTTSVIPIDVSVVFAELAEKMPSFTTLSSSGTIKDLPVVIKGHLSAKYGLLRLSRIPIRAVTTLGYLMP